MVKKKMKEDTKIVLPRIDEKDIPSTIQLLKDKNLLENEKCIICQCSMGQNFRKVGGFIPNKKTKKINIFCDKLFCRLDSFFLIKKHNGNGSPLIIDDL